MKDNVVYENLYNILDTNFKLNGLGDTANPLGAPNAPVIFCELEVQPLDQES